MLIRHSDFISSASASEPHDCNQKYHTPSQAQKRPLLHATKHINRLLRTIPVQHSGAFAQIARPNSDTSYVGPSYITASLAALHWPLRSPSPNHHSPTRSEHLAGGRASSLAAATDAGSGHVRQWRPHAILPAVPRVGVYAQGAVPRSYTNPYVSLTGPFSSEVE